MDVSFITNKVLVMPWRLLQTGRQKGTLKCIDLHGLGDRMFTPSRYFGRRQSSPAGTFLQHGYPNFAGFRSNGIRFLFRYRDIVFGKRFIGRLMVLYGETSNFFPSIRNLTSRSCNMLITCERFRSRVILPRKDRFGILPSN